VEAAWTSGTDGLQTDIVGNPTIGAGVCPVWNCLHLFQSALLCSTLFAFSAAVLEEKEGAKEVSADSVWTSRGLVREDPIHAAVSVVSAVESVA